jgi:hypothetical protein
MIHVRKWRHHDKHADVTRLRINRDLTELLPTRYAVK